MLSSAISQRLAASPLLAAVVLCSGVALAGCRESPVEPTPLPVYEPVESLKGFPVSGVVFEPNGTAVSGAVVRTVEGHQIATTDDRGAFTGTAYGSSSVQMVFTVEADGFEPTIKGVGTEEGFVNKFRLHRIARIAAGDRVDLAFANDGSDSTCDWEYYVTCRRFRVTVPADGTLSIAVASDRPTAAFGLLSSGESWFGWPFPMSTMNLDVKGSVEITLDVVVELFDSGTPPTARVTSTFEPH